MSGEYAGHGKTGTFSATRNCVQILETCQPLSMFGMLWIDVYDSVFQFPPMSNNVTQPLKRSGTTFHRPQSTA
jgi:hypothetical protein